MGKKRGGGRSAYQDFVRGARAGARLRSQDHAAAVRAAREETYHSVTNRPTGELDAGIGTVDGNPALYEQGGWNGNSNRVDVYSGPHGPFGDPHGHITSNNGGDGADYVREPNGEVRTDSRH